MKEIWLTNMIECVLRKQENDRWRERKGLPLVVPVVWSFRRMPAFLFGFPCWLVHSKELWTLVIVYPHTRGSSKSHDRESEYQKLQSVLSKCYLLRTAKYLIFNRVT